MKKSKRIAATLAAFAAAVTLGGCAASGAYGDEEDILENEEIKTEFPAEIPEEPAVQPPEVEEPSVNEPVIEEPTEEEPPAKEEVPAVAVPKVKTVSYIGVTADGVNIRSGAGTNYAARGTAEKSTLYALNGESGSWYKTGYKNGTAYLSSKYCKQIEMTASEDERIEAVIAEGTKLLGTAYVFGAVRYHDGSGHLLKNFTTGAFDCSSLMQYIFYKGAHVNLQVNTRTQIYQGKTVTKSQLKRGDLMFFTNASRKNNTGIERVGHVALYLGGNWILHTASDYAKIEQISDLRWSYFIQGQRIF